MDINIDFNSLEASFVLGIRLHLCRKGVQLRHSMHEIKEMFQLPLLSVGNDECQKWLSRAIFIGRKR